MTHPYESYTKEELIAALFDYETSITWDTNCLTCGKLYDKIYELDVVIQRVHEMMQHVIPDSKWREEVSKIIDPYVWGH